MARYLTAEPELAAMQASIAAYYGQPIAAGGAIPLSGLCRDDMEPEMARLFAVDQTKPLSSEELANIISGHQANGEQIPGASRQGVTEKKGRVAWYDFTFSAPKSFSVAWAFSNPAERGLLDLCHREAVDSALAYLETQIAVASRGKGGKRKEPGRMAWWKYEHFTARPTLKQAIGRDTLLTPIPVNGDMQRHTHVVVPNIVRTASGHVGALNTIALHGRVKEIGRIYQAFLATNLRRLGIDAGLDQRTFMAMLRDIPHWVCEEFSKRTTDGEAAARSMAEENGLSWDSLSEDQRADFVDTKVSELRRSKDHKQDGLGDFLSWQRQAEAMDYHYTSVMRPGKERQPGPLKERLAAAYETSLPVLEPELQRRSRFEGAVARAAAVAGLIEHGIINAGPEIAALTHGYRTEGVRQNGQMTELIYGKVPLVTEDGTIETPQFHSFTTGLHVRLEQETIELIQKAAADKSSALSPAQITAAAELVEQQTGIRLSSEQMRAVEQIGTGGRTSMLIGAAGVGKTSLLRPLVRAWQDEGRETIGVTLAWRQAQEMDDIGLGVKRRRVPDARGLTEGGVTNNFAMAAFLYRGEKGWLSLDDKTVVVVDEISQVGTQQLLRLMRLQAKYQFQVVTLGDHLQTQAVESGHSIRLFQKALGSVPELVETIRQVRQRDADTSLMFRHGQAEEAIDRMDEDGSLHIVPGGSQDTIRAAVDFWQERLAQRGDENFSIGISAPTNRDTRDIGAEVRRRRIALGEVKGGGVILKATDQRGEETYDLAVSIGDKLRLFDRVVGTYASGHKRKFGNNGAVVDVVSVDAQRGMVLRNAKGRVASVEWGEFCKEDDERLRLTYGYALTIDSRQGDTVTEHITVMPNGSRAVNAFGGYTSQSRHREASHIFTSQGEELEDIRQKRPLGDPRNDIVARATVRGWIKENIAANLKRQPEKALATDFLEAAKQVRHGAIRALQAAWHRAAPTRTRVRIHHTRQGQTMLAQTQQTQTALTQARNVRPRKSETEILAEFADALAGLGLRLSGPPIMDGKPHNVPVVGNKPGRKSGAYAGRIYENGHAGGWAHNRLTNQSLGRWKVDAPARIMSPQERAEERERNRAAQVEAERARAEQHDKVAGTAGDIWRLASPPRQHGYLTAKNISASGARQRGEYLLVPMVREIGGEVRNLQWIKPDRSKLFGVPMTIEGKRQWVGGPKAGLFGVVGRLEAGTKVVAVTEGWATAKTVYEATSIPTVWAIDSSNMSRVAEKVRTQYPDATILIAGDNDHSLPHRSPPLPNAGMEAAKGAAAAIGGVLLVPDFEPHENGTDWNDWAALHGLEKTKTALTGRAEVVHQPCVSR